MLRRGAAALLTALVLFGQAPSKRMSGVVVDQDGKPVAGISIDHTGDWNRAFVTDAEGRFVIQPLGPFVVLRKAGYQSERVAVEVREDARLTIRKLPAVLEAVPSCPMPGKYGMLDSTGAFLRFPLKPGVKASAQGRDIDASMRTYSVKTSMGKASILHGAGFSWSSGSPSDEEVWESLSYEERRREGPGFILLDAQGRKANGQFWRYLGHYYESASYTGANEQAAKMLDQVLDGVCRQ